MSSVAHLSIYHSYYHVISQPDFCSSRSIFLIFDLITDADADKSEFFTEPGITIPLMCKLYNCSTSDLKLFVV